MPSRAETGEGFQRVAATAQKKSREGAFPDRRVNLEYGVGVVPKWSDVGKITRRTAAKLPPLFPNRAKRKTRGRG